MTDREARLKEIEERFNDRTYNVDDQRKLIDSLKQAWAREKVLDARMALLTEVLRSVSEEVSYTGGAVASMKQRARGVLGAVERIK